MVNDDYILTGGKPKLSEIVRETQNAEETFESLAAWKLEDMEAHPNPSRAESDLNLLRLYAHVIRGMGENTDALIEMSRMSAQ